MDLLVLRIASLYQVISAVLLTLGSAVLWREGAVGVAVGGVLMAGNFWLLRLLMQRLFQTEGTQKGLYGLLLVVKFVGVIAVMVISIMVFEVNALGLAIGMSSFFGGMLVATLQGLRSTSSNERGNHGTR